MDPIFAPPVRTLDYGFTAPNAIDWLHAGQAVMQPLNDAIARGNENRNQFLLQQVNSQKAMELARAEHQMQIQREQMRDQRMLDVAKLRAQYQVDALKEKGALDDIKSKSQYLTSRLGGDPVPRFENETDAAYSARLDNAIKQKLQTNITTDTKAAYSVKQQIDAYNNYLQDPRVQTAVSGEMQKAVQDPGVQAQAANYVQTNLSSWLNKVAPNDADAIQTAIQTRPDMTAAILQRAGLGDSFQSFQQAAAQQAAYSYLKAVGSPAAKQVATANDNLKLLTQQYQNLSTMQGDNGRMVPKPWWSDVDNSVTDLYAHDLQVQQQTQGPPKSLIGSPPAPARNPFVPPAPLPGFDANGNAVNTAPFARAARGVALGFDIPPVAAAHAAGIMTDQDVAAARAANPGFLSGAMSAPAYWARGVGSLFDSSINPADTFTGGNASYNALPLPAGAVARQPGIVAPQPTAPVVAPAPAGGGFLPPLPQMAPAPAGAAISPLSQANMFAPPPSPGDTSNPFDQVMQGMMMRSMYSQ